MVLRIFFSKRWEVRVKNNTEQNEIIVNNPWNPMQAPKIYYWTYERPKGNQKTFALIYVEARHSEKII